MNATFTAYYIEDFVNSTSHCTTGDAKLIPFIIPNNKILKEFQSLFNIAIEIRKKQLSNKLSLKESEKQLLMIQEKLDTMVNELYDI